MALAFFVCLAGAGAGLMLWSTSGMSVSGARTAPLSSAIVTYPTRVPVEPTAVPTIIATTAPPTPSPLPGATRIPTPTPIVSGHQAIELQKLVDNHAAFAPSQVQGLIATIAVSVDGHPFRTGPEGNLTGASEAKIFWVLAAVDAVGLEPVAPWADQIFGDSDNHAAGRVIDLIGIDAVNEWTRANGMDNTYLESWNWGRDRRASDRFTVGHTNRTSSDDAARILSALANGELFDEPTTSTILDWMKMGPDTKRHGEDWGATFANGLPAEVAVNASHKAGWLPPNCCAVPTNHIRVAGVIPLPDGTPVVIAISAQGGSPYKSQADWVSAVVADVYAHLTGADTTSAS